MNDGPSVELGIAGLGPAVRIGSGGFADVYRAQQTNLRREVAVKVLRAPANEQQARMRFERECHAVGAVSGHPNIVAVHEGGFTADGRAYLVMEYFPGGSLLDRLQRDGPMAAAEVIDIGLKIGRALGVAHQAGVVHRDVKPANILVSAYGEPALADFGIARVEGGQQTATGLVTASFAHAAPEVLEGGVPSPSSDLYSLGSTLFELFTGQPPHVRPDDQSVWALMNRVVSEPVPDPASVGMPEPLASTVRRATHKEPTARHRTAPEFVAELEAAPGPATTKDWAPPRPTVDPSLDRTTTMAQPPTAHDEPPLERGKPRRGLLALFAGLVVVGAVSGAGLFAWSAAGSDEAPLVFEFPSGSTGPLDEGVAYDLDVQGGDPETRFRLVVDGEAIGTPAPALEPFVPTAGRHSLAIEVSGDGDARTTETVELYVIGELPPPGWRANLLAVTTRPANWGRAIERFDELLADGHDDLLLLPSDRFPALPAGYWNFFVPGFGEDRAEAVDYCDSFGLAVPDDCFVTFFDPGVAS